MDNVILRCVLAWRRWVMTEHTYHHWADGAKRRQTVPKHLIGSCHGFTGIGACISLELVKQWLSWIYHAYAKIQGLHLQIKHQVVESFLWYAVMEPHCEGESRERHKSVIQLCKNHPLHQAAAASPAGGNCLIYLHFHFATNCTKTLVCCCLSSNMPAQNQFSKSNETPNLR